MKLYAPSTIRDIRDRYGFKLSKSLGQNFLTDKNIIDKIIEATEITEDDLVIEIGPGIGVLTAEAARLAKKVVAVEIDKNLIPILKETLAEFDNVEIINQDVLKTDLNEIIRTSGCKQAKIIGNLPYYITTPIIMGILENHVIANSITIMMQKEVADRIKSQPGTKAYGALSVAVQYYCTVDSVAIVPKEVFVPIPKVDSAVLRLNIRGERPVDLVDEDMFFRCIKAGFGQRRKTLSNSLMGVGCVTKEEVKAALNACDIDEKRRAETLSLDEFACLANYFGKRE
ncbi:16S rRNA (adenine(1518)-N(6)/adenine(1519)-N(6))-dimethyltransferase RsmA [Ihubacter sp. rT4E-8]|uniref:16S rRNA (adenine(1518)-N(6)/adenine(1519)-N(6))- dimethyltransferase RsmA n=1 Tax=unclassified Ihubacter TaxID=2633299 RepID=UPI00137B7FF5